jgi:Na+-transporting methylmalonyl-CoA/oxaloacetate decarboxylase gamma subunit
MVSHNGSRAFGPKNMGVLSFQSLLVFAISGVSDWHNNFIQESSTQVYKKTASKTAFQGNISRLDLPLA